MAKTTQNPNLVQATLEKSSYNSNSSTVTLYYRVEPTSNEVATDLLALCGKLDLSVDLNDPHYQYLEKPTPVSTEAGLKRYECYPSC